MRGVPMAVVVASGAFLALPGAAFATTDVSYSSAADRLDVRGQAVAGEDDDHRLIIEAKGNRREDGWRVRQGQFGDPAIGTSDGDCFGNPVFNDVVCGGEKRAIDIRMDGNGEDNVTVREIEPRGVPPANECRTAAQSAGPITVALGAGDDVFRYTPEAGLCPAGSFFAASFFGTTVDANGGSGRDEISGTPRRDTMQGAANGDRLSGLDGNDLLRGGDAVDDLLGGRGNDELHGDLGNDELFGDENDDTLFGERGNDLMLGGEGADRLRGLDGNDRMRGDAGADNELGQNGNDTFLASGDPGADILNGNVGVDTLDWGNFPRAVNLTLGGAGFNDGPAGALDSTSGMENAVGGSGDDSITGSGGVNNLRGGAGRDVVSGGAQDDDLNSGPGNDTMLGGTGDDVVNTRDGQRDDINCGGNDDLALIDLVDDDQGDIVLCEIVRLAPVNDAHGSVTVDRRVAVARDGRVALTVACPRTARVRCAGRLTVRGASASIVLGRAGYSIALGDREDVVLRLRRPVPGRIVVETSEQGVSDVGPRGSRVLVDVLRSFAGAR
jgi:Ca2+-binding RTX toxin-like protein